MKKLPKSKAGKTKPKQDKSFRAEVWQDGMMMAAVEGRNRKHVERDILHYAMVYGQDGPVQIKWR